jgi:hypothetical protein
MQLPQTYQGSTQFNNLFNKSMTGASSICLWIGTQEIVKIHVLTKVKYQQ